MTRSINPILLLLFVCTLAMSVGCLGERFESNVPPANLELWNGQDEAGQDSNAGRPRYLGPRDRALPNRGTLNRGTLNRGTLNSGEIQRGTLNRGTLDRGALNRGTLRSGR